MKISTIYRIFIAVLSIIILLPACREEKKFKIGVSQCSSDDWREKMNRELRREAMFHDNVELEIRSADDNNEKQIEDIRYFADNGFDIVIVAPNEAEPITPVIDEIMSRNIPVLVFDRSVKGDNFTAYQGASNDSIGYQAARYTASTIGPNGRVLEIFGNPGSTPAQYRHEGFEKGRGNMTVVASAPGFWNYDDAYRVADSLLNIYPDVDAVFAHNDRMAIAASDAASKRGINPLIVGIDAAPEIGMEAVKEGKIDATFIYPTEGYRLLRTALAILEGKPYERISLLPAASVVDKSNFDIVILQNEALREETNKIQVLKDQVDTYWNRHSIQTAFLYVTLSILAVLCVLLFFTIRLYWKTRRQQAQLKRQNVELEHQRDTEKQLNLQLEEATQSKLMFFTNVSHDLRTPLTLIAEPVRQLSGASNLTDEQSSLIKLAQKNVRILQRLINQILDFRRYENGKASLHLVEVNIGALVADWTDAFHTVARKRHIKLSTDIDTDKDKTLAIDVEKIERVFFNLLSNAFKYTPDNGRINVGVAISDDKCEISVKDTGRGIAAEDLGNIFDRFYQVDKVHPNGSGIGLSLAKAFVELHQGSISVESKPGEGSIFRVVIPVHHVAEHAEKVESTITASDVADELNSVELPPLENNRPDADNDEKPVVLVIDDNEDILALVRSLLSETYNVITADNGADGLRLSARYVPDLIISDVMMPKMDGLECCHRIKEEVTTSHIPVLMLTACSMDEERAAGYESGADGYLSKPFNADVLKARVRNLIDNRRRILNLSTPTIVSTDAAGVDAAAKEKPAPQPQISPSQKLDNEFYRKFLEIFSRNISDPEINVDALAAELGLGRSQFYRKIKALTNYSPVELIRKIRLEEARNMLLKTEKSVSEIAYAVGFSTPAYFTKCYREAYDETPSETRAKLGIKS